MRPPAEVQKQWGWDHGDHKRSDCRKRNDCVIVEKKAIESGNRKTNKWKLVEEQIKKI